VGLRVAAQSLNSPIPPISCSCKLCVALDREPVAAQDGLGQQASARLTLAFLSVKQVIAGARRQPGGEAEGHLAPSRGEGRGQRFHGSIIRSSVGSAGRFGGLTSFATTWLTQQTQVRAQQLVDEIVRRQELYKDFIEEASRLYADAFEHDKAETSKLVNLYALVSRMRVHSALKVTENADKVVRLIIEMYLAPNKTFRDVPKLLESDEIDFLREFSNACGEELRALRSS